MTEEAKVDCNSDDCAHHDEEGCEIMTQGQALEIGLGGLCLAYTPKRERY